MHDPRFEKDVQQKMEELSFVPSAAVWQNVENAVRGERKRRAVPFWLILLPALLAVGGGLYWGLGRSGAKHSAGDGVVARHETAVTDGDAAGRKAGGVEKDGPAASGGVGTSAIKKEENIAETEKNGIGEHPVAASGGAVKKDGDIVEAGKNGTGERSIEAGKNGTGDHAGVAGGAGVKKNDGTGSVAASAGRRVKGKRVEGRGVMGTNESVHRDNEVVNDEYDVNNINNNNDVTTGAGKQGQVAAAREIRKGIPPGLGLVGRNKGGVAANIPGFSSKAVNPIKLSSPKRPLEVGFVAGIGFSSLNQGLLDKASVKAYDYRNSAQAIQGLPQSYDIDIRPNVSFYAGVMLQKGVSQHVSMSGGVGLHYYSSLVKTGDKVAGGGVQSSPITGGSASLLNNAYSAVSAAALPYYPVGNSQDYANRYYFLELPLGVNWQVGHDRRFPLYVEGGVNFSYLVASSALYYDPKTSVFYKDQGAINKLQTSVYTGLLLGLPVRGIGIQAGPVLQYGFSNLVKGETSGQHLLYGGIKVVFIPTKTKKGPRG